MSHSIIQKEQNAAEQVQEKPTVKPLVDIYENEDEFLLFADMPGVSKEQLSIEFHNNMLTLEGQRKWNSMHQEEEVIHYHRSFKIQRDIDLENVKADLKDGVLAIHLPKSPELKPRQIQIQSS